METTRYKVEIIHDEDARGPDEWNFDDPHEFLIYDHRDFCVKVDGFDANDIFEWWAGKTKERLHRGYYVFPVYAYIHSGVALSLGRGRYPFNDRWDVSFKGFALIKREKGSYTALKAMRQAKELLDTWNTYLSGDVWGFNVTMPNGVEDSCWGFYGKEYCKEEALNIVYHHV